MQINSIKNIVMGTALAAIAGSSVINTCSNTTTQNNLSETAQIIHTPRIVPSHPRSQIQQGQFFKQSAM